jgi:hypothetical protein
MRFNAARRMSISAPCPLTPREHTRLICDCLEAEYGYHDDAAAMITAFTLRVLASDAADTTRIFITRQRPVA